MPAERWTALQIGYSRADEVWRVEPASGYHECAVRRWIFSCHHPRRRNHSVVETVEEVPTTALRSSLTKSSWSSLRNNSALLRSTKAEAEQDRKLLAQLESRVSGLLRQQKQHCLVVNHLAGSRSLAESNLKDIRRGRGTVPSQKLNCRIWRTGNYQVLIAVSSGRSAACSCWTEPEHLRNRRVPYSSPNLTWEATLENSARRVHSWILEERTVTGEPKALPLPLQAHWDKSASEKEILQVPSPHSKDGRGQEKDVNSKQASKLQYDENTVWIRELLTREHLSLRWELNWAAAKLHAHDLQGHQATTRQ